MDENDKDRQEVSSGARPQAWVSKTSEGFDFDFQMTRSHSLTGEQYDLLTCSSGKT